MKTTDAGFRPVRARQLEAGQMVYVGHCQGWFKLAMDPTTHRFSENVVVLHFDGLPRPEYRLATAPMRVRSAGQ